MAITGIYTNLSDTMIGTAQSDDGIAMLCVPAAPETGGAGGLQFNIGTPYLVTSLNDITNLGITSTSNSALLFQAGEFFAKAGNGAKLWIVGYMKTAVEFNNFIENKLAAIVQETTVTNFDNRPRMIGVVGDASYITDVTAEDPLVPILVQDAATKLNTTLNNLFSESIRCCAILDGMTLNCTTSGGIISEQTSTRLPNAATFLAPRVGVMECTSTPGNQASVGMALGLMASISLATSIGDMTIGQLAPRMYMLDANAGTFINTSVSAMNKAKCDDFGKNQYIFARTRPQMPGVYFNDGATCNDPTMALSSLEFVRVGNAVCDITERYFVRLINTKIPTTATGAIDAGYKASALSELEDQYLKPFIDRQDAQRINVDFQATNGNFIESRAIDVSVKITPSATLREVYEEVIFVSTY